MASSCKFYRPTEHVSIFKYFIILLIKQALNNYIEVMKLYMVDTEWLVIHQSHRRNKHKLIALTRPMFTKHGYLNLLGDPHLFEKAVDTIATIPYP